MPPRQPPANIPRCLPPLHSYFYCLTLTTTVPQLTPFMRFSYPRSSRQTSQLLLGCSQMGRWAERGSLWHCDWARGSLFMSSDNHGRHQTKTSQRFALCEVGEKKGRPCDGNQALIANCRANTGATPSLNRSGTNEGIEKPLSTASEHSPSTGSEVGSSVECRPGNNEDGEESSPEDSETP